MNGHAAQDSIERVIESHHDDLFRETWDGLPEVIKALQPQIGLVAAVGHVERWLAFSTPELSQEYLQLPDLPIGELADRFPDCELSW